MSRFTAMDFGMTPSFYVPSVRIIEDIHMVDHVEDWSRVRSPARARRRRKRGFPQNIVIRAVPKKDVYSINGGKTLVMHPELAREIHQRLNDEMTGKIERAILTGKLA